VCRQHSEERYLEQQGRVVTHNYLRSVTTIEHNQEWCDMLKSRIAKAQVTNINLLCSPVKWTLFGAANLVPTCRAPDLTRCYHQDAHPREMAATVSSRSTSTLCTRSALSTLTSSSWMAGRRVRPGRGLPLSNAEPSFPELEQLHQKWS
jgi:hypothetical protein